MELLPEYGDMVLPIAVVTGTHSSGKTTVIDDYARFGEIVKYPDLDFPYKVRRIWQKAGNYEVPIFVVPEAARCHIWSYAVSLTQS